MKPFNANIYVLIFFRCELRSHMMPIKCLCNGIYLFVDKKMLE